MPSSKKSSDLARRIGLSDEALDRIKEVFAAHPEVASAKLFGSRAKGTHTDRSDIDLALWGSFDDLHAERIAADLDELPIPYRFEVIRFDSIRNDALKHHIERVGIEIASRYDTICDKSYLHDRLHCRHP